MRKELKGEYKPIWEVIGEIGARIPAELMPVNVEALRARLKELRDEPYLWDEWWSIGFRDALQLALGSHAVEQLCKEEE